MIGKCKHAHEVEEKDIREVNVTFIKFKKRDKS